MTIKNQIDKIQPNGYFPQPPKEAIFDPSFVYKYNLFPIVPLINGDKTPYYDWKDPNYQVKSKEEFEKLNNTWSYTTTNGKRVTGMITGACLVCGEASNIIVIDLDRHGNKRADGTEIDGVEEFDKLLKNNNINKEEVKTITTKTPSDGVHKYFKYNPIIDKPGANGDLAIDHRTNSSLAVLPGTKRRDAIEWKFKGKIYTNPKELVTVPDGIGEKQVEVSSKDIGQPTKKIWKEYSYLDGETILPLSDKLASTIKEAYDKRSKSTSTTKVASQSNADNKKAKAKARMIAPNDTIDDYYQEIKSGGRSTHLCGYLGHLCRQVTDTKELYILASLFNQAYINPPMSDAEIMDLVAGAEERRDNSEFYINWKNKKIDTGNLVQYIIMRNHLYAIGNKLFWYDDDLGVYVRKEPYEIEKIFYEKVQNFSDIDAEKARKFLKSILSYLQVDPDVEGDERRFIACDNGVIDTETDELLPHSPDYKISCKFNGNYNPNYEEWKEAFDKSKFKKFLLEIFSGDEEVITVIGEIFGNILCPHQRELEKVALLYGGGSNGKSSLFDIMEALFHDVANICSVGFKGFGERFALAQAVGKRANFVRDDKLPTDVGNSFRSFVSGERISIEDKNMPLKLVRFNCATVIGVNKIPNTENKTHGWYRRNLIIPFKVRFGNQSDIDEGKADKLIDTTLVPTIIEEEMDIIFNFAYYGFKRLKENGFKFSYSTTIATALEEYRTDTDSVYSFILNRCSKSPDAKISTTELYEAYKKYCDEEDITPQGRITFRKSLEDNHGIIKRPIRGKDHFIGIFVGDEVKEVIDYEKKYKELLKEKEAVDHNNEVSKKLIEKLRTQVALLEDERKTDIELILRLDELEKEKAELLKERDKYIDMYNEEIQDSNKLRVALKNLRNKGIDINLN